jgi:regulator of protease activity HflC (stomatin/prohibitin superfamily)
MKKGIFFLILVIGGVWFLWQWGFCRFYVDPDEMAIITAKSGDPLPPDQILAKEGQKGVQENVLAEGRHFRNPYMYDVEVMPVTEIPPGKVGIVTAKVGTDLPEGVFLADRGQKGIWRGVLGPGKYRLNPYGYQVDITDAISIPIGYVGVMTGLAGEQAPEGAFAGPTQKGVRKSILQPGLYYVNPKELKVDVVEIGVNQVSLLGKTGGEVITKRQIQSQNVAMEALQATALEEQKAKRRDYLAERAQTAAKSTVQEAFREREEWASDSYAPAAPAAAVVGQEIARPHIADATAVLSLDQFVEFPSRDGFNISLDMTVEFELVPENIAWIFQSYGDLPAVVDKIIMPQILSVSRLKGSAYRAKDFIVGEGREKFQGELTDALAKILAEKKIIIHNALIRHVNVPMQILDPIQQASIAVEQDLTNKEKQNTAKKQGQLNTEISLIDQNREKVAQETEKLRAEISADKEKQVAEIAAEAQKQVAEVGKQTADVIAQKTRVLGETQAQVTKMVEGEKANGFELKARAFGDPTAYALWEFAGNLNKDVKVNILHAGQGTFWTDIEKGGLGPLGTGSIIQQTK